MTMRQYFEDVASHLDTLARPGEHREDRKPPGLLGVAAERPNTVEEGEASQGLNPLHGQCHA